MNALIDNRGLVVNYNAFKRLTGDTITDTLTLRYQGKIGAEKVIRCYQVVGSAPADIILPRYFLTMLAKARLITSLTVNFPHNLGPPCNLRITLYPYQQVVLDHLLANVFTENKARAGVACGTLNLRAGAGKTFVAAGLIVALGVRALCITFRKPLAKQARDDFAVALSDPSIVDVVVINKALKMSLSDIQKYSLVIIDEVHTMCSDKRKNIFTLMHTKYTLAMSATTSHRKDGFDRMYHLQYGPVIDAGALPGFDFAGAEFKLYVDVVKYTGPPEYTKTLKHESTDRPFVHYMYGQFIADATRTTLIVEEIRKLYIAKHNIFVFAEEREHLQKLIEITRAQFEGVVDESDIGYYVGGIHDDKVTEIKNNARIVFTTYNLSSTGTSWVHMTAIVMATPRRSNMEQLAARIMRMGSDVNIPRRIIDIVDNATCLRGQINERMIAYERYEAKIKFRRASYLQIQQQD